MKTSTSRKARKASNSEATRSLKSAAVNEGKPATINTSPANTKERLYLERSFPNAKKVFIAGSFNSWQANATPLKNCAGNRWSVEIALSPGIYEYRFVVDDMWVNDPLSTASAPNPFGSTNNLLSVTASHVQN